MADREVCCFKSCTSAHTADQQFLAGRCSSKTDHSHLSFSRWCCAKAGTKDSKEAVNELALTFFLGASVPYSASRTSKQAQHLHSIFVSTYAILFLGKPPNGSSTAEFASIRRHLVDSVIASKIFDSEGQLLDALNEGPEALQNITYIFVPLLKDFRIYLFWEQEKTDCGGTRGYVRKSRV